MTTPEATESLESDAILENGQYTSRGVTEELKRFSFDPIRGGDAHNAPRTFGDALRDILGRHGLMVSHVAEDAGFDPSLLSRWLSGTRHPTAESISLILPVLERAGVSAGEQRRLYLAAGFVPPDVVVDLWELSDVDFAAFRERIADVEAFFAGGRFMPLIGGPRTPPRAWRGLKR